jgi:YD repeat-containing protein
MGRIKMDKTKEKALNNAGWKLGSVNEFLGIEKLDFRFSFADDMLQASTYSDDGTCNGFVEIHSNLYVSASFESKSYQIKNNCKDIYEALDAANQWYDSIRNKNQNEENTWEHITKDKNGRIIKREKSDGFLEEFTYNSRGQELTHNCSDGKWTKYSYNEAGLRLKYENSEGYWIENTYNDKGQELTLNTSEGYWVENTYNDKGSQLTHKCSDGFWEEYTYNENDECTHYKNSEGENIEYDYLGKLI